MRSKHRRVPDEHRVEQKGTDLAKRLIEVMSAPSSRRLKDTFAKPRR
jgi:hypothetical protein